MVCSPLQTVVYGCFGNLARIVMHLGFIDSLGRSFCFYAIESVDNRFVLPFFMVVCVCVCESVHFERIPFHSNSNRLELFVFTTAINLIDIGTMEWNDLAHKVQMEQMENTCLHLIESSGNGLVVCWDTRLRCTHGRRRSNGYRDEYGPLLLTDFDVEQIK